MQRLWWEGAPWQGVGVGGALWANTPPSHLEYKKMPSNSTVYSTVGYGVLAKKMGRYRKNCRRSGAHLPVMRILIKIFFCTHTFCFTSTTD
jgi:hypothetical protein